MASPEQVTPGADTHVTYVTAASIRTWRWKCSCGDEGPKAYHSKELAEQFGRAHEDEGNNRKREGLDLSAIEQRRQQEERAKEDSLDRDGVEDLEPPSIRVRGLSSPTLDGLAHDVEAFLWANDLKLGEFYVQMDWRDAQNVTALVIFR